MNLKKALNIGSAAAESKKRKALFANIKTDINPEDEWELIGEIGDGAFGKVHKARRRDNPELLAAAKICVLENENDLEDFMVEINILSEVQDDNIIQLLEAFYYQDKLWVSFFKPNRRTTDPKVRLFDTSWMRIFFRDFDSIFLDFKIILVYLSIAHARVKS